MITLMWIIAGVLYLGLAVLGVLIIVDLGLRIVGDIKRRKQYVDLFSRDDDWRMP